MANQRVTTPSKCLFCNKRQPSTGEVKSECYVEVNGKELRKAFWICEQCSASEKDRTRALHGIVLAEAKTKICDNRSGSKETAIVQVVTVDSTISTDSSKQRPPKAAEKEAATNSCCCQACMERKRFEQEQLREVQNLQKSWVQVRHAVRQMFRERLLRDGATGKGRKFIMASLRELIEKLCSRDPHQLYQRLESLGREHVMELKVLLLQILVSPEKEGVNANFHSESAASNISIELAEHFLRSLLHHSSQFFETVDNMKEFLAPLEREHLEKFGITWRIVNCSLFESVVFHDPLLQSTLPSIYSRLGLKTVPEDNVEEGCISVVVDRQSMPAHLADLIMNFVDLGATLSSCRSRMVEAQNRMENYLAKQMKIYKATLKAKQKILKQDLEFFKRQRRLLEEYVSKKRELKKTNSGDEDVTAFAETLRCLISGNNRSNGEHSASTAECVRCHRSHCPCDQCSISHLIACGLTADNADIELQDSIQFLDELNESSNSSGSESDDSDYGAEEDCVSDKRPKMDIICHKQTSIICEGGQKITKVEATIMPTNLFASQTSDFSTARHMYNAYSDWEMNADPSTLLFSNHWEELLLAKCAKQNDHTPPDENCIKPVDQPNQVCRKGSLTVTRMDVSAKCNAAKSDNGVSKVDEVTVVSGEPCTVKVSNASGQPQSNWTDSTLRTWALSKTVQQGGKPKYEWKEKKPENPEPQKKPTSCSRVQVTKCESQFTQEWFKDPKNAKYAKALLACAVAGNSKEVACLKDLNLDVETVKKLYAQHVEAALKGNDQATGGAAANGTDGQKQKGASKLQSRGDSVSADEDDDSWSDHSSVVSQKENKHCDCCYCEMFGHGGNDNQKPCGRDEYPQIRERLRMKLRKKESKMSSRSENVAGYRGDQDINTILEFIEGAAPRASSDANASKSKKAKAKAKRNMKKEKRRDSNPNKNADGENNDADNDIDRREKLVQLKDKLLQQLVRLQDGVDVANRLVEKSKASSVHDHGDHSDNIGYERVSLPNENTTRDGENEKDEDVNIDEVFKPKDIDLNCTDLDEAEREVECFKRFVMNCQPAEKKQKIRLNLEHLLKDKKSAAATAFV